MLRWRSTRERSIDPAFLDFVGVFVECEEADIGGGIAFGFVTVRIQITGTSVDFRMRRECRTRQFSIEVVDP